MKNFIVAIVSVYLTIVGVMAGFFGLIQYIINWVKKLGCIDEFYEMLDKDTRKKMFKTVGLTILAWPYWAFKGLTKGIKILKAAMDDEDMQNTVREAIEDIKSGWEKANNKEQTEEKPEEESEDDEF